MKHILFLMFFYSGFASAIEIPEGSTLLYDSPSNYLQQTAKIFVKNSSGQTVTYIIRTPVPATPAEIAQFKNDARALQVAVISGEKVSIDLATLAEVTASARIVKSKFPPVAQSLIKQLEEELNVATKSVSECVESRKQILNSRPAAQGIK
jgi:hypothetical protein